MPPPPVDPTVEIHRPWRCCGRITTQWSITYEKQLGHRVQHATSKIRYKDPTTYCPGVNGWLKGEWTSAMNDGITALNKNQTYNGINKQTGRHMVGSQWVFKIKKNAIRKLERFQPRDIVKGLSQTPGFDFEKSSTPLIQYESLILLLAI